MKWKSHVLEALVLLFFALFSIPSSFAQMPENGGFEERGTAPPKGCLRFFSKAWTVALNSGAAHCDARLAGDALEGAYCLELINRTPGRFISASQNVPVSPGREVTASVYVKGTSGARCLMRFHFLDSDGNRVGKYKTMGSSTAPAKWTRRNTRFIVPPHVQNMQITVENLLSRKAASVFFDKYELSVGSGTLLENEWIRASVNPMLGGCLDSVVLRKGGDVELTRPNGMTAPGGMAVDMIPGGKFPGLVRAARYECEVLEPLRRIRVWHVIASRKLNGLKVEKTYSTPANLAGVRVAVKLSNGSREPMAFTYRVHNVLKAAAGTYTWPTADWLQAYHRDLGGNGFLQDIKTENLKSGWIGRSFAPKPHGILFQFENRSVAKAYSYFGQELETVEWYYRRISLAPGQAWETTYTVYALGAEGAVFGATGDVAFTVTPTEFPNEACKVAVCSLGGANAGEFTVNGIARRIALSPGRSETMDIAGTVDKVEASLGKAAAAVGQGYGVEYVQGIDLPEPPAQRPVLPSVMQGYFPYAIDSPPISFPEAAGSSKDRLRHLYSRIIREARRDYFNTFYNGRMVQPGYLKQLVTSDGKHEFGELARKYNMRFVTNTALFGRDDVDLAEFAPRLKKKLDFYFTPQTRRFLATYHDRLLCYFTGDEPMGKNIPAMLEAHAAMRSIDPDRVCLPYLNLNRYEYAPYVPVYLGDFYPIKHKDSGGRNPWSMQGAVTQAVSKAGPGVPVWVMPQGFAYFRGTYALATAEEMRLMLYGAVANGCKGIVFHGWAGEIPWRTKYGYHYSYFDMRPTRPLWNAISECGRELTAFGHLLFNANPERAFRGATVVCDKFVSHDRFYDGPAITVSSLKRSDAPGRILIVLNQNDTKPERGVLQMEKELLDGHILYDLTAMRRLESTGSVALEILPGDARAFLVGPADEVTKAAASVFRMRCDNERVRYQMDAELGTSNTIDIRVAATAATRAADIDDPGAAFRLITKAQKMLHEIMRQEPLGQAMADAEIGLRRLDETTFLFRTHFDLVMPPDLYKAAKRYRRMKNTADPTMQAHVDAVASDYSNYWRLEREVQAGNFTEVADELGQLTQKMHRDAAAATSYLRANEDKIRVDNPYD